MALDGFRTLAVTETPAEVVIEIETTAERVGCAGCGVRAEAQDRMPVEIRDLSSPSSALERLGFTREGVQRESAFRAGAWRDGVMYSILRNEWVRGE